MKSLPRFHLAQVTPVACYHDPGLFLLVIWQRDWITAVTQQVVLV